MKFMVFGFILTLASFVVAKPLLACGKEHGYTKTAEMLEQSSIPVEEKTRLKQRISRSEADHHKYTKNGNYVKMNQAVRELASVKETISR